MITNVQIDVKWEYPSHLYYTHLLLDTEFISSHSSLSKQVDSIIYFIFIKQISIYDELTSIQI